MTTKTNEECIEEFKKKFQHWDGIKVFCEPFLTEKEILVLEMRGQGKTLEEVGKAFRVTRERVRQIEAKANEKVRMKDYFVNWLNTVLCEKDKETALAVEKERERIWEKLQGHTIREHRSNMTDWIDWNDVCAVFGKETELEKRIKEKEEELAKLKSLTPQ